MKIATTARSRSVILVWTFISISQHRAASLQDRAPSPKPDSDGFSIYLFAYACLPNGNYFQFVTGPLDGPPVLRPPGGLVFGRSGRAPQIKNDGEFDFGFALFSRGKKVHRASECVFPFGPAFDVIAGILGDELLRDRTVIEIADREGVVFDLGRDVGDLGMAEIILH